jgi:hypothetical protein
MMSPARFGRPPRIAIWLVDLFIPDEQAESIPGDLLEEFTDLAAKSGVASARKWYWRQSVKTIAHLSGTGFRDAPWLIAGLVLIGLWLMLSSLRLPELAIVAVLRRYPIHVEISELWNVWVPLGIEFGRVIVAMFAGCIVAVAAKRREIVATVTLAFIFGALAVVAYLMWSARHRSGYAFMLPTLVTQLASAIAIVIGGGIVRKFRSALSRRASASHC